MERAFSLGRIAKLPEDWGAYTEVVEKPAEIIPAVQRATSVARDGRPAVLEVITKEEPVFSK